METDTTPLLIDHIKIMLLSTADIILPTYRY